MPSCSKLFGLAVSLLSTASAMAVSSKRTINPTVKGTPQVLGRATEPSLNRDSCGSVRFQSRDFWTCRDTQTNDANRNPTLQVVSSSASWTEINTDGSPYIEPFLDGSQALLMTGNNSKEVFYTLQVDQCNGNTAGSCGDGSRYAIWPDSPPIVTSGQDLGPITAYTWVLNEKINSDLSTDILDPSVTLYKVTYDPSSVTDDNALPVVSIVDGAFWAQDAIPYGAYGNVITDGVAYLYGKPSNRHVALAKVSIGSVEDKSAYQYWVNGAWTTTAPSKDDATANIVSASAGGQGTYYYSEPWQSYVWIGQAALSISADFFITTAPDPTGPWEHATRFYSGVNGNATFGGYSLQAHPQMVPSGNNEIYLSYTKTDRIAASSFDIYTTPLILVEWE